MTSNHRKQGKEKTLEKTYTGEHFDLCPDHPSAKAQNNHLWGLHYAYRMQGTATSVSKAF